jgi:hypothetical protein
MSIVLPGRSQYNQPVKKPIKCSVCGERDATAYWMGAQDIFVCRCCATNSLISLVADSVLGELYAAPGRLTHEAIRDQYDRMIARFWYAMAEGLAFIRDKGEDGHK